VPALEASGRLGGIVEEGSVGKRIDFACRALCWPWETMVWFLRGIS
jgi:hypothetical protein